jgi:Dyp-type peroxidase family
MTEPQLKLYNIQGNILAGFNKDHQCFLFVNFPTESDPQGWLREIAPEVASTEEVDAFNKLFKRINERRGGKEGTIKATWMNLALSASSLSALGVASTDVEAFSPSFREGMKSRAAAIGDVGANAPEHWVKPLGSSDVHAVVILASDTVADLDAAALHHIDRLGDHDLRLLFKQDGRVRSDLPGHEHFGFKDGISQPGIRGFTPPSSSNPDQGEPGQDRLWPGEFVLGYPTQQKPPAPPAPLPQPPNYETQPGSGAPQPTTSPIPTEPGPEAVDGPAWAADGSYLVFRRLRQDVQAFASYVNTTAATEGIAPALLGAKLVGRYKSGCPLEHTGDEQADLDPQVADPSIADPTLLSDAKINNFEYTSDVDGAIVPRAAHIRKSYPRDEATPGGGEADTQTHRLLRRGIPYGEPYDSGAQTGSPQAGDAAFPYDRGLLFLCYQRSIEDQFEVVQSLWVNSPKFPEEGDGEDPILAQASEQRAFHAPGLAQPQLSIPQFVTTTGGEYFFAPSLSALGMLAGQ